MFPPGQPRARSKTLIVKAVTLGKVPIRAAGHVIRSAWPLPAAAAAFALALSRDTIVRLKAARRPGESYSDVILRMAEASEGGE